MATTNLVAGSDVTTNVVSASTTSSVLNANDSTSLQNEFLTLMVAQIQNQDPLNPSDGTEYVSQLAQFSQLESAENMLTVLENNEIMMNNLQVLTTASMVDREVTVRTNVFDADAFDTLQGNLDMTAATDGLTLVLTSESGVVKEITLGSQSQGGRVDFELDTSQLNLSGWQTISVVATNGEKPNVNLVSTIEGVDTSSSTGVAMLDLVGLSYVPFYDVVYFGQ